MIYQNWIIPNNPHEFLGNISVFCYYYRFIQKLRLSSALNSQSRAELEQHMSHPVRVFRTVYNMHVDVENIKLTLEASQISHGETTLLT